MQFDLHIKLYNGLKSFRQQLHTSLYMSDTYLIDEKEIIPQRQRTTKQTF